MNIQELFCLMMICPLSVKDYTFVMLVKGCGNVNRLELKGYIHVSVAG